MPIELPPARPPAPKPPTPGITGRHVLFGFIAFFGVIAAVNATMMTLAIRSMPGIEVKSAYEASQRFNRELDAIAAQDRLGWRIDIGVADLAPGAPLEIEAHDAKGAALTGLEVRARLERPTDARFDRSLAFTTRGLGRYAAVVPQVDAGQWRLSVEIYRDGARAFVSERRVLIKGAGRAAEGG